MAGKVVLTNQLSRRYGDVMAVDNLNLEVFEGEVFGLLGPNGAGKTTTILMLLGLTEPTAGTARVLGHDPTREPLAVKRQTGYLPDNVGFYDHMTGRENLRYTARLNGLPSSEIEDRIQELLEEVGMSRDADRRVGGYSRGMRQRLGLADVLLKRPRLVILDEPTTGLDPKGARELLDLIARLRNEHGVTIILSSHQLHQVQEICDRVGIFVRGRMIAAGPIDSLGEQIFGNITEIEVGCEPLDERAVELVRGIPAVSSVVLSGDKLIAQAERASDDVGAAMAEALVKGGYALRHLHVRSYELEHIYERYFREGSDNAFGTADTSNAG